MKKLAFLALVAFLATPFVSKAQEYKKFKVGLGFGYAMPGGAGAKGGVLLYMEPAYRINDKLQAGLRLEGAIIVSGGAGGGSASALGSYTLNGQYYFNNNNFRPFAGLGLGLFDVASGSAKDTKTGKDLVLAGGTVFGFYPRVGFDLGHLTMSLDYNIVTAKSPIKANYLGVRMGFNIGGGKN